jgi:hypothetical protein
LLTISETFDREVAIRIAIADVLALVAYAISTGQAAGELIAGNAMVAGEFTAFDGHASITAGEFLHQVTGRRTWGPEVGRRRIHIGHFRSHVEHRWAGFGSWSGVSNDGNAFISGHASVGGRRPFVPAHGPHVFGAGAHLTSDHHVSRHGSPDGGGVYRRHRISRGVAAFTVGRAPREGTEKKYQCI